MSKLRNCHDCAVAPGAYHKPGCDVERCPLCGGQMITCGCDHGNLKEKDLLPWTGIWPGEEECIKFGFWCKGGLGGWIKCDKSDPEARPNLNRLYTDCVWDKAKKAFVLKEKASG